MSLILRKSHTADTARQYATSLRLEHLMEYILEELKRHTLGLSLGLDVDLSKEHIT